MSDSKFTVPLKSKPSTPVAFGNPFYIGFDDDNEKGILLRSEDEHKLDLFLESYSQYEKNLIITAYDHGLLVEHSHRKTFYNNKGKVVDSVHGDEDIIVYDLYLVIKRNDKTQIHYLRNDRYIDVQDIVEDEDTTAYMI